MGARGPCCEIFVPTMTCEMPASTCASRRARQAAIVARERGGLSGRVRPSIDEKALHVLLGRSQCPVTRHAVHLETGFRKAFVLRFPRRPGRRLYRRALVGSLMTV
jgi:hypothetical protein